MITTTRLKVLAGALMLALTLPAAAQTGVTFQQLKSFGMPLTGGSPRAGLVAGSDGAFYGVASTGGTGAGTVFKLNQDGTGFSVLQQFDSPTTGGQPTGLMEGSDGALYGTALGGSSGHGTVFKLNRDGTEFSVLQNLDGFTTGRDPYSGLVEGVDGALYGTAQGGGSSGHGTVFKLNRNGTDFTVLQNLDFFTTGGFPSGELIEGTDGALYGTASSGGPFGIVGENGYCCGGTVFKLNRDGTGFNVLKNLDNSTSGGSTYGRLVEGTDGALYGTAGGGGSGGGGTVFKLNRDGTGFNVLQNLSSQPGIGEGGGMPQDGLMEGSDGMLYGTATSGGSGGVGTVFKLNRDGSGFTVLQNLDFYTTGGYPDGELIEATDGALYGTAATGGSGGFGTVYRLNSDGTGFTVLHHFDNSTSYPLAGLTEGTDGGLYGTTIGNVVFKINRDGTDFTVLKTFDDPATTGSNPQAGLMEGSDGALYGAAAAGGSGGVGTVFKLNRDGTGFVVLQNFYYSTTGGTPLSRLVEGTDGVLYGTTVEGGSSGYGTLFKLNRDGTGFSVLKNFDFLTTGGYPLGELIEGTDGALYGTTVEGGSSGYGTLFRLNRDGTGFTALLDFDSATTGVYPVGLIQGTDGSLYGTASEGGAAGAGTIFRLLFDNTSSGPNVSIAPFFDGAGTPPTLEVTFDSVAAAGLTTVTPITAGPPPPGGFQLSGQSIIYDISTSASFSGPVQVCFGYDESQVGDESNLRLFHYEGGQWVDVTVLPIDTVNDIICGTVTSLSPFAVFEMVVDTTPPAITCAPDLVIVSDRAACGDHDHDDDEWDHHRRYGRQRDEREDHDGCRNHHGHDDHDAHGYTCRFWNRCVATGVTLTAPTVTDNCTVASVVSDHPSTTYPLGETLVTWTATDAAGNSSTCVQKVIVVPSVEVSFRAPVVRKPTNNTIRRGQVVPFKVELENCLNQTVRHGVTVKLQVQGIDSITGDVFQDVTEDANGLGTDGTVTSDGLMQYRNNQWQFNLDTGNFGDPNTVADSRYYRATVSVIDNATLAVLGVGTVNLETGRR